MFSFLTGAAAGSFIGAWAYRYLTGVSIVTPGRSYCPSCFKVIPWHENIPIFSWAFLKGRCSDCSYRIPADLLMIEIFCGVLFLVQSLVSSSLVEMFEGWFFICILLLLAWIDWRSFLLPDTITLSGTLIGVLFASQSHSRTVWDAAIGAAGGWLALSLMGWLYYILRNQEGIGGGDIKLLALIGAFLGWQDLPAVILLSSILGGIYGLWIMRVQKRGLQTMIPFGPFLALGAILIHFFGKNFSKNYLDFLLPV